MKEKEESPLASAKANADQVHGKKHKSTFAKPKIHKVNNKLDNSKRKSNKGEEDSFLKYFKQGDLDVSKCKIITPRVKLKPDNQPDFDFRATTSKTEKFPFEIPMEDLDHPLNNRLRTDSLPMIIKANLKKSSKSYLPKILQCDDESMNEQFRKFNNTQRYMDDLNCHMSKALQDFYNEIAKESESLENQTSQMDKKSVGDSDKSVQDSNNLMNVEDSNNIMNVEDSNNLMNVEDSNNLMNVEDSNNLMNVEHKSPENISFTNKMKVYSLESKVIVILCPNTQFSFLGKLRLKVLYGAVQIYGSIFDSQSTARPVEIYSPRGYSSINISNFYLDCTYNKDILWDALTIEGIDKSLKTKLHNAINKCDQGWSVILLENFENILTNFLKNYCSFRLFPKVLNVKYSWCHPKRAEYILQAQFQEYNPSNEISICPQWDETVIEQLINKWNSRKSMCTMIIGGKSVGKSTTARYLVNNLLRYSKKVVLVDLDPGQAEMTPSACLSLNILDEPLLGPNFTHLKIPFYQLYLDDINITNCLTRYIQCIKKLVECLRSNKDLEEYPVIVNTMGFSHGIGLDICIFLIKLIQPNNIIQIQSNRKANNFDVVITKETVNNYKASPIFCNNNDDVLKKSCDYELYCIASKAEGRRQFDSWNMEPRQRRELVLLSYLSQIIKNADYKCLSNFTLHSINNVIPFTLPFSSFYISLIKSSIAPTHILSAMNGNIVALCGVDLDDDTSAQDKSSLKYPVVLLKPPPCTCYGYGIVRGFDLNRRCIYINTPLLESELQQVNLLAGCSAMPFALLHSGERASAPYAGDRGELPTSREAHRGQFRVGQGNNMSRDNKRYNSRGTF